MIKNGLNGASTKTGIKFQDDPRTFHTHLYPKGTQISGYKLYSLVSKKTGLPWKKIVAKRIIPDEAYLDLNNKTFTAYEKKTQTIGGSVDEKLQTCAYKIRILRKVCKLLDIPPENVKYIYTLDYWFKDPCYQDVLEYIKETPGCDYEILGEGENAT